MALSPLSPSVKILFVCLYLSPLDGDAVCADDDLRVADADAAAGALHARVHGCVLLRRPDRRLRRGVDNRAVVRLVMIGGGAAAGYRARARHVCKDMVRNHIKELEIREKMHQDTHKSLSYDLY